jgi:AcrR family transcriptional regulator
MCASRADRSATISAGRKTQILEAAKEIFLAKGFSQASTAEIAEKAGVSQGTIFHYYPTKYELCIAVVNQYLSIESMANTLNALPGEGLPTGIQRLISERLTIGFDNSDFMLLVMSEIHRDQHLLNEYSKRLIGPVLKNLETFLSPPHGLKKNRKTARIVARLLMASIIGLVVLRKVEGKSGPLNRTEPAKIAEIISTTLLWGTIPPG